MADPRGQSNDISEVVRYCAQRLALAAALALSAADGPTPECGAEYLVDVTEDLAPELSVLAEFLRRHQTN